MAAFSSKPLLFLEENQYNNFVWVGESFDGCLLCVWEEEILLGGAAASPNDPEDQHPCGYEDDLSPNDDSIQLQNDCEEDWSPNDDLREDLRSSRNFRKNAGNCSSGLVAASLTTATHIAIASPDLQSVQVLYTFDKVLPVVQATVNASRTLLGYVTREEGEEGGGGSTYSGWVAEVAPQGNVYNLNITCHRQVLLEFLNTEETGQQDARLAKLLVLVHRDSGSVYSFPLRVLGGNKGCGGRRSPSSCHSGSWVVADEPLKEGVCGGFVWAQWNPRLHHLYYLHHRPPSRDAAIVDNDEAEEPRVMLTALQFHATKPHETVLNVPLELAGLDSPGVAGFGSDYRDEGLLHITADPWLDMRVLASPGGALCICHHYIYKSREAMTPADPACLEVYVAYSVTLLHQRCVLHAVLDCVPWTTAHTAQPCYALTPEYQYLVVVIPGVCCHLLDVSLDHTPAPHLLCPPPQHLPPHALLYQTQSVGRMTSPRCLSFVLCEGTSGAEGTVMRVLEMRITKDSLYQYFKCPHTSLYCRLAVLHMAAVHDRDQDLTRKLIWSVCSDVQSADSSCVLQEYLVSETYAALARHLQSDAQHLLHLLPFTTCTNMETCVRVGAGGGGVRLSYCPLESAPIMILAPRERVTRPPYADTFTHLHTRLHAPLHPRFDVQHVVDKLVVSFQTYKPEALSRGMTPLTPASPLVGGLTISSLGLSLAHLMFDPLPFPETENTTCSKLEHLLSVSLRELTMHALKELPHESPMRMHAVASKYVCTQLQVSRRLCSMLCSALTVVPCDAHHKGFSFIDGLSAALQHKLLLLLQRYVSAADSVGYPLPQGFSSFLSFLAYRALPAHVFQQHLVSGVLALNTDVLREIIYDCGSDSAAQAQILDLLSCAPAVRSLRALQYLPAGLRCPALLTARNHAATILNGDGPSLPTRPTRPGNHGAAEGAFPTLDRTSPYATLLALITAKAKLSELDVGLLYEGTLAATALAGRPLTAHAAPH